MTVPASTSRPRTPWGGVSVQTNGRGSASLASQKVAERTHQPEIIAFGRYEAWDWPVCMVNFDPTHFGSVVGVPKWEMSGYQTFGPRRPDELAFTFTIERLNTSTIQDANEYHSDDIESMIRLARWAEAQVHHFGEEVL